MALTRRYEGPEPGTPDPVRESPPHDRFCDLVLTGGVASGVVYPWAVTELARHFRFRSIGGNSVGAMAAALAAAAEYGRCCGYAAAFEPLRLSPGDLAEEEENGERRTRMLRLFQPGPGVHRLFRCLLIGIRHSNAVDWERPPPADDEGQAQAGVEGRGKPQRARRKPPKEHGMAWQPALLTAWDVLGQYRLNWWWVAGALVFLAPAIALAPPTLPWFAVAAALAAILAGGGSPR